MSDGFTTEERQALLTNVGQIETVARRHEEDAASRRTHDLNHMEASATRERETIERLIRVEAKLDQLLAE